MNSIILSSSILSADFSCLRDQIRAAEEAGVDWIHVDVMDGSFVPNITMGPFIVETVRKLTRLPLDVHLMIDHPERHIQSFASAGANILSIHAEGSPNLHRTLQSIQALGCKPSVVVNPGSPAEMVEPVLELVDMVLVMTVNPGYSGQVFIPSMVTKIAKIQQMISSRKLNVMLQVDGGITAETLPAAYQAGARSFVAATSIFKFPAGIAAGTAALRQAVA